LLCCAAVCSVALPFALALLFAALLRGLLCCAIFDMVGHLLLLCRYRQPASQSVLPRFGRKHAAAIGAAPAASEERNGRGSQGQLSAHAGANARTIADLESRVDGMEQLARTRFDALERLLKGVRRSKLAEVRRVGAFPSVLWSRFGWTPFGLTHDRSTLNLAQARLREKEALETPRGATPERVGGSMRTVTSPRASGADRASAPASFEDGQTFAM